MKNDLYDPLGIEIFVIEESFESMFSSLKGVYFRLYWKESKRPEQIRNKELEASYYKRFEEITPIKKGFRYNDWEGKRKAVDTYASELREMVNLELTEYAS